VLNDFSTALCQFNESAAAAIEAAPSAPSAVTATAMPLEPLPDTVKSLSDGTGSSPTTAPKLSERCERTLQLLRSCCPSHRSLVNSLVLFFCGITGLSIPVMNIASVCQ